MSAFRRGCPLKKQAREIINNVHEFMTKEAQESKYKRFTKDRFLRIIDRTAQATKVSKRSITRILKEKDQCSDGAGPSFKSPKKGQKKKKYRVELDDFGYQCIRRKIYDFLLVEKQAVTVNVLLEKLKEDIDFKGSRETLRRIIKELGFKFIKTKSNRKLLVEKDEVRLQRIKYLREVKRYRHEGREIVYGDETYVHFVNATDQMWPISEGKSTKKPSASKGTSLVIVHAGSCKGFIPNALLMYTSQMTGNKHGEMNKQRYVKWLLENLIPNLPPNCVFVIDNAGYHNALDNSAPNSTSSKKAMQEWLVSKNLYFDRKAYKPELYEIIKRHKHQYVPHYAVDAIMESHGHKVLRLPPYHPDFNPMEIMWAQVKGHVNKFETPMNLNDVQQQLSEKIATVGQGEWKSVVDHTIMCEDDFIALDDAIDYRLDQFIINTVEESSSSSDSSNADSDSSSSSPYSDSD